MTFLGLFLVSCATGQPPAATPAPSLSSSLTPSSTPTPSPAPTQTFTPTPTPEPAWYQPPDASLGRLKYQYAQVLDRRAKVYASLKDAEAQNGNFGYLTDFPAYIAYSATETAGGKTWYFMPVYSGWMDGASLQPLTASSFTGILLTRAVDFRFGWVLEPLHSTNAAGVPIREYPRYQLVHEVPAVNERTGAIAVGADEWLPADKVALVNPEIPADVGARDCRFIHVNLAQQVLTVYDRCVLVFATLISSGANSWTFEGNFTILNKADYSTIRAPEWSTSEYYMEAVPWFMSYAGSFGFHGAYWHDDFGTAASHGCINLSPTDAKWLYDWAVLGEKVIISAGK